MDHQPRVVIRKRFNYEGTGKEWANSYHFNGDVPADYAAWNTFVGDVIDAEKTCHVSSVHIIGAQGWNDTDDFPVFSATYDVAGTLAASGASSAPGDCVTLVRYTTAARSTTNHPIYAFNYFHGAIDYDSGSGHPDGWLYEPQRSAFGTYAQAWIDGIDGHNRCTPKGEDAIDYAVDPWIRHRDFRR